MSNVRNKSHIKGKEILNSSNKDEIERGKQKATWDSKTTKNFIDACLSQSHKGERSERTLTKKGWRDALIQFNSVSKRNYDKTQFKNKWDSLKKEWSAWYNLFQHETGVGWNSETYTFLADSDWWDAKEKVNPLYAKYRDEGLPFAKDLTFLFKDKTATGQFGMTPSAFIDSYEEDEQCNQGFQSVNMDMNEGSGDSDDPNIGNTSGGIGVTNISLPGRSKSGEKIKREGDRVRKGKMDSGSKIGEELKKMAEAMQSHTNAVVTKTQIQDPSSIGIIMAELHKMEEVVGDADFFARCCEIMMKKPAREMFIAIPNVEPKLIFLRHLAYKEK